MTPEVPDLLSPHKLRRLLVQRINHLSDQLAVETLRLFQELLKLPYQPIIDTLIVRNFCSQNYLDFRKIRSQSTLTTSSTRSSQRSIKRKDKNASSAVDDSSVSHVEKNIDKIIQQVDSTEINCVAEDEKILPQDVGEQDIIDQDDNSISAHDEEAEKKNVNLDQDSSVSSPSSTETVQQNTTSQPDYSKPVVDTLLKDTIDYSPSTTDGADNSTLENTRKDTEKTPAAENEEKSPEEIAESNEKIDENADIMLIDTKEENIENTPENNLKESNTTTAPTTEDNKQQQQQNLSDSKAYDAQEEGVSITDSLEDLDMSRGFNKRKVEKAVNG